MTSPQDTFIQEARDILQSLEEQLLELEAAPDNKELVDAVFRGLHTLKGSGDMFGFTELARFIHHFEDAFDRIRDGRASVSSDLIAVALDSRDHLAALLDLGADAVAPADMQETAEKLLHRLADLQGEVCSSAEPEAGTTEEMASEESDENSSLWNITFAAEPAALKNGFRPELLWAELAELGRLEVTCLENDVPCAEDLDPGECYLTWSMTLETKASKSEIEEVFIFFIEATISIERAVPDEVTPEETDLSGDASTNCPVTQETDAKEMPANVQRSDTVRVQADRLDDLMDQLGELVISQAKLKSISDDLRDSRLSTTVEEIEALVTSLRDTTLSIRMLPISMVFGKFRRVVRDLSVELGKPTVLLTEGGETEVDKNIIDNLTEPLVHMIRNSVDHGVETVEARRAAGKSETATVRLSARQSGGEVLISVSDDGGGLKTESIRKRAIDRGLITEDQKVPDDALYQLIFEPGFSTSETLSAVSGRGVGMDAVRRVVVENLRGSIDVRSSPGVGTEVTLRLPLTLAIIDGLLVEIGNDPFVLPLSSVEECVDLPESENNRDSGRAVLHIRDELVPYITLDALFGYPPSAQPGRRVAIVNAEGQRVGLVVDDLHGQLQTVIKPLSNYHRDIEALAGATILGDGSIALILDVNALVRSVDVDASIAA